MCFRNITRFAIQNGLTTGVLHPLFLRGVGAALAHKKNWLEIREKCTHVELLKFFPEEIDGRVGGNFYKLDLTQKASVVYICNDFGAQFISWWEPNKSLPKIASNYFRRIKN